MNDANSEKGYNLKNPLSNHNGGDLQTLNPFKFLTRSRLFVMLAIGILLGTPFAVPTFANYLESLASETPKTEEELAIEKQKRHQQLLWGSLLLTFVGGAATFKSLHKMESIEESDTFFIGDDLEDEEEDEEGMNPLFEELVAHSSELELSDQDGSADDLEKKTDF